MTWGIGKLVDKRLILRYYKNQLPITQAKVRWEIPDHIRAGGRVNKQENAGVGRGLLLSWRGRPDGRY